MRQVGNLLKEIQGGLWRKNGDCAACLKNSVRIFVDQTHKVQQLRGNGVPVLYTRRKDGSKPLNPF